jgi:hypothetical protein
MQLNAWPLLLAAAACSPTMRQQRRCGSLRLALLVCLLALSHRANGQGESASSGACGRCLQAGGQPGAWWGAWLHRWPAWGRTRQGARGATEALMVSLLTDLHNTLQAS